MLDVAVAITSAQSTQPILAREPSRKLTSLHAAATARAGRTDMPRNYQSHPRRRRHCSTEEDRTGPAGAHVLLPFQPENPGPSGRMGPVRGRPGTSVVRNCRRVSLSARDVSTPPPTTRRAPVGWWCLSPRPGTAGEPGRPFQLG
ncbi:hypothetical protein PAHAL_2G417700 [Panicum hallii]|uniref:Uncharacterized protein n=1 Tax=Panicum hallii TaxID=206008 RepID=A0A2S3H1X6_9POAL|nr:hypothetical protein PAHAL_2G417700 [Panicum hallii]